MSASGSAGGNHLSCCHKWGSAEDGLKNGSGENMAGADGGKQNFGGKGT